MKPGGALQPRSAAQQVRQVARATPVGQRKDALPLLLHKRSAIRRARWPTDVAPVTRLQNLKSSPRDSEAQIAKAKLDDDPSPYFDGFVRSLLLGAAVGGLFEAVHGALKLMASAHDTGLYSLNDLFAGSVDQFAPLFVQDHVAAIGSWFLLYGIEVFTIMQIMKRYPNDEKALRRELKTTRTLPRKMLPVPLRIFKNLILAGTRARPSTMMAAAAAAAAPPATAAPPAASQKSAFTDGNADGRRPGTETMRYPGMPSRGAGVGTLERPPPGLDEGTTQEEDLAAKRRKRGLSPGAWDPSVNVVDKRNKELADRKGYLKNFWYAAALSDSIAPGEVKGVEVLGMKLSLFRDADTGVVRAISDVCPHRGAPLSGGWLGQKDGHTCVVCPYHGWAIDAKGYLRDVPAAEQDGEWPTTDAVVPSYPVQEKGGFVWLFNGSDKIPAEERPPIPYVPELDDPKWKAVYGEIEFECGHWGVFENAVDVAHIHYLHGDTFGNQDQPEIRNMHVTNDHWGVTANFSLHNKPVSPLWEWTAVPAVEVTASALLPSTSVISFSLGNGLSFTTFVNTVPIGPNRTVNRFSLVRKLDWDVTGVFNADAWDQWAVGAMERILGEDKAMVETLRPDLLPREISVKADLLQTAFRKLRQSWVDMGYIESSEQQRFIETRRSKEEPDY